MAALLDKFTTNALQTPVGVMISRASDEVLPSEDWTLIMEICDYVNTREEGPKDAARAIRKRFQVAKSTKSILYVLIILETCMKNCGYRFQIHVCQKEFIQDLVKLLQPARNPSLAVQEKIVALIQNWTDAFSTHPDLKGVALIHEELRLKGIIFPESDPDEVKHLKSSGGIGFGTQPGVYKPPPAFQQPAPRAQTLPNPAASIVRHPSPPVSNQPVNPPPNSATLTQSQIHKLQRDLDVVQSNCRILSDMLNQLSPGQEEPAEYALLKDLNGVCRQMQSRLVELIEQVSTEDITCELLRINDELNQVFVRYDRYERIREVHTKNYQSPAQNSQIAAPVSQPVAPDRNHSLMGDDQSDQALQMAPGAFVPKKTRQGPLPPIASRTSNIPTLTDDLDTLVLDAPEDNGAANPPTNAASNPMYEDLLFTGASQTPVASNDDGFGGQDFNPKSSEPNRQAFTSAGDSNNLLSVEDIESFLNTDTSNQTDNTSRPNNNPFESANS